MIYATMYSALRATQASLTAIVQSPRFYQNPCGLEKKTEAIIWLIRGPLPTEGLNNLLRGSELFNDYYAGGNNRALRRAAFDISRD